jgi:hypothetical protein
LILAVVAGLAGLGLLMIKAVTSIGLASTSECRLNVFYYLFARNEPPVIVMLVLMAVISPILLKSSFTTQSQDPQRLLGLTIKQLLLAASTFTFCVTLLGTHLAFHNYPLSMDEYMADFQAIIFSQGRLAAVLESPWRQFAQALTPTFCTYDATTHSWISAYLPVYAALRSLFWTLKIPSVTNPLLAAASVLVMAKCAQRILPDFRSVAVAVLLLVVE